MNMAPPHGAVGHPSHSPGMQARQYPQSHAFLQQQQQHQQQQMQQQAYLDAAGRGRKRKLTTQNAHLARRPSGPAPTNPHMQQQQHQHHMHPQQHPQHAQYGPGYGRHPPSAFLGLNLPPTMADELPDNIVDDLDRLTPRDIAVARYARNHELLSTVFDARRIDSLQPAPSPYAQTTPQEMQAKADALNSEISQLSSAHVHRMAHVKQVFAGKASDHEDADHIEPQAWAKDPFRGKILGLGFVRAATPEEQRKASASNESVTAPMPPTEEVLKRKQEEREAIERLNASLGPDEVEESGPVQPPAPPADIPSAPLLPHTDVDTTTPTTAADTTTTSSTAITHTADTSDAAQAATAETVDQAETAAEGAATLPPNDTTPSAIAPAAAAAAAAPMQDALNASNAAAQAMDTSTLQPTQPSNP